MRISLIRNALRSVWNILDHLDISTNRFDFCFCAFTAGVHFNRQLLPVKKGGISVIYLAGWALGPIVCALSIGLLSEYGLIVPRIIFAHFIVIGFWVWVKRLDIHENYADAPNWLLAKDEKPDQTSSVTATENDNKTE